MFLLTSIKKKPVFACLVFVSVYFSSFVHHLLKVTHLHYPFLSLKIPESPHFAEQVSLLSFGFFFLIYWRIKKGHTAMKTPFPIRASAAGWLGSSVGQETPPKPAKLNKNTEKEHSWQDETKAVCQFLKHWNTSPVKPWRRQQAACLSPQWCWLLHFSICGQRFYFHQLQWESASLR